MKFESPKTSCKELFQHCLAEAKQINRTQLFKDFVSQTFQKSVISAATPSVSSNYGDEVDGGKIARENFAIATVPTVDYLTRQALLRQKGIQSTNYCKGEIRN